MEAAICNPFVRRFLAQADLSPQLRQQIQVWYAEVRQLPRVSSRQTLQQSARCLGRWGYSRLSANELHQALCIYSRYHRYRLQQWLSETPGLLACCPQVASYLSPEEKTVLSSRKPDLGGSNRL